MMLDCQALLAALSIAGAPEPAAAALSCREAPSLIALAPNDEAAHRHIETMQAARSRFHSLFDREPPASAMVQGNQALARAAPILAEQGYEIRLPWVDPAEQTEMLRRQVARQIDAQAPGLPEAQRAVMIEQAMAGSRSEPLDAETEASALSHEFGHMWFQSVFWGGGHAPSHYGGAAPDWMDELAAVALENEAMAEGRRAALIALRESGALPDLATLLSMEHPLASLARAAADLRRESGGEMAGEAMAVRLSGAEAARLMASAPIEPSGYYAFARSFLDYLTERGGGVAPLTAMAEAMAQGADFETWLGEAGPAHGLPEDLAGLEAEWTAWLAQRS